MLPAMADGRARAAFTLPRWVAGSVPVTVWTSLEARAGGVRTSRSCFRAVLDLDPDARPVWWALADLASMPVWPKRLGWRIADWHANEWPDVSVRLSDSSVDLGAACDW
jgi:hypothetical protein